MSSSSSSSSPTRTHASQPIIPLVQSQWKRSVISTDVNPSRKKQEGEGDICKVCNECESRYTCPRCTMPYCSVACYKQHDADGTSCTESFYKDRVNTVLQYEAKEQSKSMQHILTRSHPNLLQDESDDAVSDEDLWRLAEELENGTMTDEDIDRMMTPEMRLAFRHAVVSGELSSELGPWHPWWMPELVSTEISQNTDDNVDSTILDERLIKVPAFRSFRSGPLPDLTYNVVDLLYSIARTLRLYHGVDNAIAACRDSCQKLIESSAVLREDARHDSVAEAFMRCTAASNRHGEKATLWTELAQDVIFLCSCPRHVSHAFLDAVEIIKAAIKELKSEDDTEGSAQMRLIKKKLDFYLSWSREACLPAALEDELRLWVHEWNQLSESEKDTLLLPNKDKERGPRQVEKEKRRMPQKVDSFMKAVSSRQRNVKEVADTTS